MGNLIDTSCACGNPPPGPVAQEICEYIKTLDDVPHCVRVISGLKTMTKAQLKEEFISKSNQPFPFVMAGKSFQELSIGKSALDMFKFIGYETDYKVDRKGKVEGDWLFKKLELGTKFYLVVFGVDEEESYPATWDGILSLLQKHEPACATKIAPHIEIMRKMPIEKLLELARSVDEFAPEDYALVDTFEHYENSGNDSVEDARGFLRHTLKCTTLFRGDGFAYDDKGKRGAEEILMPRVKVSALPLPSTKMPSPIFCVSDDVKHDLKKYRLWHRNLTHGRNSSLGR